jgi:CDGSH-type Zn-finger protein
VIYLLASMRDALPGRGRRRPRQGSEASARSAGCVAAGASSDSTRETGVRGRAVSPMEVTITPYRDGPYLLRGPFSLRDQDGLEIENDRRVVALCRCGKSRTRPFCDGTHRLIDFRAPSGLEHALDVTQGQGGRNGD